MTLHIIYVPIFAISCSFLTKKKCMLILPEHRLEMQVQVTQKKATEVNIKRKTL